MEKLKGKPVGFELSDKVKFYLCYHEKIIKKLSLEKLLHMGQIWNCVGKITHPQRRHGAKFELQEVKSKIKTLVDEKKYGELLLLSQQESALEKEILKKEKAEDEKNELSLVNVSGWMKDVCVDESLQDFLEKLIRFQNQLKDDFKILTHHANEKFFLLQVNVEWLITLCQKKSLKSCLCGIWICQVNWQMEVEGFFKGLSKYQNNDICQSK